MFVSAESLRLDESRARTVHWKRWGPYLASARGARCARTTAADGTRVGVLSARSRAIARLSLERRRPRGHLRSPSAHLLRARAVERARSDPQGAPLRADRQRGQPRRGRQGVLLLPRHHADALVHALALQVSAARVSVRRRSSRENARRGQQDPEFELLDTGVFARRALLRRRRRVREGDRRRHPDARSP